MERKWRGKFLADKGRGKEADMKYLLEFLEGYQLRSDPEPALFESDDDNSALRETGGILGFVWDGVPDPETVFCIHGGKRILRRDATGDIQIFPTKVKKYRISYRMFPKVGMADDREMIFEALGDKEAKEKYEAYVERCKISSGRYFCTEVPGGLVRIDQEEKITRLV